MDQQIEMLAQKSEKMRGIYLDLDNQACDFARMSSLACPSGCGRCCDMADTEVSDIEALVIARFLMVENQSFIPEFFRKLRRRQEEPCRKACIFYEGDSELHCIVYQARPLICRCFGYSAERDKTGALYFALCGHMELAAELQNRDTVLKVIFEPYPPVMADYRKEIEILENEGARSGLRPLAEAVEKCLHFK